MTLALIALGLLVGYAHFRSKSLLHLIFLQLQEKAENRSEYQKHLLRQEFQDNPEFLEAINTGSLIRYEDVENDPELVNLAIERDRLLFLRNLFLSTFIVLVFI